MVAISLFIDLDHAAIMAHMNRDAWIEWFRTNHDLDLGHDATWNDVFHAIAIDHIAGGDHGSFVRSQGWDSEYDGPTVGVDVAAPDHTDPTPAERAAAMMTDDDADDDARWDACRHGHGTDCPDRMSTDELMAHPVYGPRLRGA